MEEKHYFTCYWSEAGEKERQFCITCERIDVEVMRERERIANNLYLVISEPRDAAPLAAWIRGGAQDGFTFSD
jgi:hypothetical protein